VDIVFDLRTILLFGLIAQGLFAAVILAVKQENQPANRYLALFIFLLSLWLCDSFFRVAGIYNQNPNYYFLPIYFSLGLGPLIYFYTKSLTEGGFRFSYHQAGHFLPMLLQFLFYVFLRSQDYSYRRAFWFDVHKPVTYDLELILSFASLLVYLIASRRQILAYKRKIANNFSSMHRIALNWLGSLHLALAVLTFFWLAESFTRLVWSYYSIATFSTLTIGVTILVMAAGGILQQDLSSVTESLRPVPEEDEPDPANERLDPAVLDHIQTAMTEQELFLQQELTLKEFAAAAGLSPRETSRAINQGLGVTFIDFVNQYRVERFKQLARDRDLSHLSLFGLALESGFNSKSTFNRVFKKLTGQRPSDYQKEAQNT
jgi:AraC-like DNA-binding protein